MTDHVPTPKMERFCVQALSLGELTSVAEHLAACPSCHGQFIEMLRSRPGSEPLKFTLAPEFWFRHDHVDYDQLVALADETLDADERRIIDSHLNSCVSCQEDVGSYLATREQIDRETDSPYTPFALAPMREKLPWFAWWRGLAWNPAYAAAVLVIGIALVIGVAVVLKRRAGNLEAKETSSPQVNIGPARQTPTPESRTAVNVLPTPALPTPSTKLPQRAPSPSLTVRNRQRRRKTETAGAVVALNDGQRTVTVNSAGEVSGLENIPPATQRDVADTLIAQNIEQPEIAKELSPTSITLRGPSSGQPFKLLSPRRTVIVTDRPSFEWERLPGATAYRVVVGDMRGHEVAKSEDLSSDQTSWKPSKPLKRGEIYAWNVIAIVNGKQIVSPGASASEMKFKVLSTSSVQELEQLKGTGSHLALGVFYAREGMTAEAEREFQILASQNPNSALPKRLLLQVQTWHQR